MPVFSPVLARIPMSISTPLIFSSIDWSHTRRHDQPEPHDSVLIAQEHEVLAAKQTLEKLCDLLDESIIAISSLEVDLETLADLMELEHRYLACLTILRQ